MPTAFQTFCLTIVVGVWGSAVCITLKNCTDQIIAAIDAARKADAPPEPSGVQGKENAS
jgi:hypothetical protein